MKRLRYIGSLAFVFGLFILFFVGGPWFVYQDPNLVWWMKVAIYCLMGGVLLVLMTLTYEQRKKRALVQEPSLVVPAPRMLLQNSMEIPGREVAEVLDLVKGHIVYAIWLGKDLSALLRLVLGGELTEYTDMMGRARQIATDRMIDQAAELGADAIINVRYVTNSVIGTAAELLAYGTAVKLKQ